MESRPVRGPVSPMRKCNGVRTLKQFLKKHGHPVPPDLPKQVRQRLLQGESIPQIESALGCGKMVIYNQRQLLGKIGRNSPTPPA